MVQQKQPLILFDFDSVSGRQHGNTSTVTSGVMKWEGLLFGYVDDIEGRVKGQTLIYIADTFFRAWRGTGRNYRTKLNRFEQIIIRLAIPELTTSLPTYTTGMGEDCPKVTKLQQAKMAALSIGFIRNKDSFRPYHLARYLQLPKPAPGLFLVGMGVFGTTPDTT